MKKSAHWTSESKKDLYFRVAFDFVAQVQDAMDDRQFQQKDLAGLLGVTEGRVSQVFNNPGNMTLQTMIDWGRQLGRKVSVVLYDDDDADNLKGPIDPEVFRTCWELRGRPRDLGDLDERTLNWLFMEGSRKAAVVHQVAVIQGPWERCEQSEPAECSDLGSMVLHA